MVPLTRNSIVLSLTTLLKVPLPSPGSDNCSTNFYFPTISEDTGMSSLLYEQEVKNPSVNKNRIVFFIIVRFIRYYFRFSHQVAMNHRHCCM